MFFLIFVVWVIFSFLIVSYANTLNRSGAGWFFISLFISPLFCFLILAILGKEDSESEVAVKQLKESSIGNRKIDFLELYMENEVIASKNPITKRLFERVSNNELSTLEELDSAINTICSVMDVKSIKDETVLPSSSALIRIQQLDELLQNGLILDADYQLKKSEIIASI